VKQQYRLASLVGVVAMIAAACGGGTATTAPTTAATSAPTTGASVAPSEGASAPASAGASEGTSAAPSTGTAASMAPLTGDITVWEAYGASGSAEKDAFDTMVAAVKTANPGLNVTVLDVPFNNLFT